MFKKVQEYHQVGLEIDEWDKTTPIILSVDDGDDRAVVFLTRKQLKKLGKRIQELLDETKEN